MIPLRCNFERVYTGNTKNATGGASANWFSCNTPYIYIYIHAYEGEKNKKKKKPFKMELWTENLALKSMLGFVLKILSTLIKKKTKKKHRLKNSKGRE